MEEKLTFKQEQVIGAYKALSNLSEAPLNLRTSYQIYRLLKKLQPYYDFQVNKEKELFQKYQPQFAEGGNFKFKTEDDAKEFSETMKELWETEIDDLDFKPVLIRIDQEDIHISVKDIKALQDFVIFEEEPEIVIGEPDTTEMPAESQE